MNCSNFLVLAAIPGRELQTQDFGNDCMGPDGVADAYGTYDGFEFVRSATPAKAGERRRWDWKTGLSVVALAYVPGDKGNIDDLVNAAPKTFAEPLNNAAFYRAVAALPAPDRQAFFVSLSGLYQGCDCIGPIDYSLYGLRNTAAVYAMSGCGIYLEGHYIRCNGADALAVWDKSARKFFFAIVQNTNDIRNGERRPPAAIHAFPSLENWSNVARAQFDDWRNATKWEK